MASMITGNALGIVRGVASAINNSTPSPGHSGSSGGISSLHDPVLVCYFKIIADRDVANKGLPLCKVRTPANIPGYILADDPKIAISGTEIEKERVNSIMAGGFYYE